MGAVLLESPEFLDRSKEHEGKPPTIGDYEELVAELGVYCRCGYHRPLPPVLDYYPHSEGWEVRGKGKQWLSVQCPNCGHDWSLWKIINRADAQRRHPEIIPPLARVQEQKKSDGYLDGLNPQEVSRETGKTVREEYDEVTNIRCTHSTCKTHPKLKVIYWVNGQPIGRECIKKTWPANLESFTNREAYQ